MSFGKMNAFIDLVKKEVSVDAEGFKSEKEVTLASVRAYREGRHGSERWANMAAFSEATDLFRFRVIPGVSVTTDLALLCDGDRFEITSVAVSYTHLPTLQSSRKRDTRFPLQSGRSPLRMNGHCTAMKVIPASTTKPR